MKYELSRLAAASAAVVVLVALFAGGVSAQTPDPNQPMVPGGTGGMGPGNMVGGASTGHQFMMGFGAMASMMGSIAGQPIEDEWHGANGDGLQMTTTGMMVWRKADNWTAFTDGNMTWVNGPNGMQTRPNSERFPWEAR